MHNILLLPQFTVTALLAALLFIFSIMPFSVAGISGFFPAVDIILIYYWCTYKPGSTPYWLVVALGLVRDAVTGGVFGVSALVYVLLKFLITYTRHKYSGEAFIITWQIFAVTALCGIGVQWILLSFFMDIPLGMEAALMQFLFSVTTYPLWHSIFNIFYMIVPEDSPDA